MLSELFYLYALIYALKRGPEENNNFGRLAILFLQFGLVLLDDMHFQYNSFLQGMLILSVQAMTDVKLRGYLGAICYGGVPVLGVVEFQTYLSVCCAGVLHISHWGVHQD